MSDPPTAAVRRFTQDVSLAQATTIVRDLDPALTPTAIGRLHGGSAEVFRIDLAGRADPLVLKLYRDQPVWNPAKEALVAGWLGAQDLGVATPRWFRVDESRTHLPLRHALTSWIDGRTVRSHMSHRDIEDLYVQAGALLRRVHDIPMPAFGYIVGDGVDDPRPTNGEFIAAWFASGFRRFRHRAADAALADRLEAAARERLGLLDHCAGPVLCHDDFQPGNLLAAPDPAGGLRLTGLIDFGNALAGDPLYDLAKALFCSSHEDPRSAAPLLQGYGAIERPDLDETFWLYALLHRLLMWNWLTQLGEGPAAAGPAGLLNDLRKMAEAA